MRRIFLFIIGFLVLYLLGVLAINLIPSSPQVEQQQSPQIQIQPQPTQGEASPSATEDVVLPDL